MSAESRARRDATAREMAEFERVVGPIKDFGAYPTGCPSCGAMQRAPVWCLGHQNDDPKSCPLDGQHLHFKCMCGFPWVTRLRSDPANEQRIESNIDKCLLILRAMVMEHAGEVRIDDAVLERARPFTLMLDDPEAQDFIVLRLRNPNALEAVPGGAPPQSH